MLCAALAAWLEGRDRSCDVPEIIVELMVTARQTMDVSLRNHACVKLDMGHGCDFILDQDNRTELPVRRLLFHSDLRACHA
jgi:hypothetical protein